MIIESNSLVGKLEAEVNPKPHCLFLSGGMGTYAGIRGVKEGLERQYGIGNVEVFNSIFSKDPQNPNRFEQMADVIQKHAKEGLDIIAHSLGAAELRKAIEMVKKRDKKFFDRKQNSKNLNIVLIAPSGFNKGIKGPFRFLARTWRFTTEQADLGVVSKSNTLLRGIDALTAFPPEGIASKDLGVALRKAIPELSQLEKNQSIQTIPLQKEQNYSDKLSDHEKEQIKMYSTMMRTAIADGNHDDLRYLITCYGEILRKSLAQVYLGNFESTEVPIVEATRPTMGGYIGLLNTLIGAFGNKSMKEIAKLDKKGVRVDFIVPEYDIFVPLNEAIAFFEGKEEASKHIKIAEGVAHAYPALQKMRFGETVRNLREDKVS